MIDENHKLEAIDINVDIVESKGIAYFRIDDILFDFMKKCDEKHRIIGFEWDGSRNFGVILGESENQLTP
jgi:hypothetical protein